MSRPASKTLRELPGGVPVAGHNRSEEHTSELQSQSNLVCRLLLEKKKIAQAQQPAGAHRRDPPHAPIAAQSEVHVAVVADRQYAVPQEAVVFQSESAKVPHTHAHH